MHLLKFYLTINWRFCQHIWVFVHDGWLNNASPGCRIFQVNEKGSVPVLKDLKSDKWLASSEDIVDTLEDQYPEPALGKASSVPEA